MGHNSAPYLHAVTEALKLSFADRNKFVGDPKFVPNIPMKALLSKEYAATRRALIDPDRAIEGEPAPGDPLRFTTSSARGRRGHSDVAYAAPQPSPSRVDAVRSRRDPEPDDLPHRGRQGSQHGVADLESNVSWSKSNSDIAAVTTRLRPRWRSATVRSPTVSPRASTCAPSTSDRPRVRSGSPSSGADRLVEHLDAIPPGHVVDIELPLRGVHNVVNATGAAGMALAVGVEPKHIASALARFGGVARRFDIRGIDRGVTFVDDYGHLPSEIAAVLAAARSSGDDWSRVLVVFQPNRFNRIAEIWADYADAFVDADIVVLTDIYSSGTAPIPGVTGKLLVNAVTEAHPEQRVVWLPRRDDLVRFVAGEARPGDVWISMGCGDIATFPTEVLDARRAG